MKIIKDFRAFKSEVENSDGNSHPSSFQDKTFHIILRRLAMKLNEADFSLGEFDHLYINFSTCLNEGLIRPANRKIDRYHPWYRYYDIGVSQKLYDDLGENDCTAFAIDGVKQILLNFFATDESSKKLVNESVEKVMTEGAEMLVRYKEKQAAKTKATVYLRLLDNGYYSPLLCVYDLENNEILREDLPATLETSLIGNIQLSSRRVTVKPKKNVLTQDLNPISFEF
ncbi:hypothetical protein J14TS2_42310 [Bacillus sp. J14TS2]|uniref:hypothetical protein n=1 Tax=Bacillus sp. J14TS2 TaxID=2807188 RepID=UPI001B2782BF|nr:hypothetical protein [Bacillus sp. J14TS2]GIN73756.1 hypothetical protein J14TS2_42310 [Bacillus sp. J14TS2]